MARHLCVLVTLFSGAAVVGCATTAQDRNTHLSSDLASRQPAQERPADDEATLLADAASLLRAGKAAEAKKKYEALLQRHANHLEASLGLARASIQLGELNEAQQQLDGLAKAMPDRREVILVQGELYRANGDYKGGIAHLKKALEKSDPKVGEDKELLVQLIGFYRMAGELDNAESACGRLLARDPANVDALRNLSLIYFEQGKYALSETIAINSLKLNDKDAALYNTRGLIRIKRARYPEAVGFFVRATELDPGLVSAHLNLGSIALRYRDYDTAARHFSDAMRYEPRHFEANLGYGLALSGQQKAQEAVSQLQRALELKPDSADAMAELAMLHKLQLNKLDDALAWCGKYREVRGGKLREDDPMKPECAAMQTESDRSKAAKRAMDQMKAQEEALAPKGGAGAKDSPAARPEKSNSEKATPQDGSHASSGGQS